MGCADIVAEALGLAADREAVAVAVADAVREERQLADAVAVANTDDDAKDAAVSFAVEAGRDDDEDDEEDEGVASGECGDGDVVLGDMIALCDADDDK